MQNNKNFIKLPESFKSLEELDNFITNPDQALISFLSELDGDIMILGIGGKVGSHIGYMAKRAINKTKNEKTIYGVSRFSDKSIQKKLESQGIKTIICDLLNSKSVSNLPKAKNVIYMVGRKFGTQSAQELTWAMNTLVPANIADHFKNSRIVVFSTGCVYDLNPVLSGGSVETDSLTPIGEYSNSAVGRERIFEYYSSIHNTSLCMFRLNYAIEMRYGVLREIGLKVFNNEPLDLSMGHVNVIWQGDVARMALLSFGQCTYPSNPLNITGPEIASVRYIANQFGKEFSKVPFFIGEEKETALLSNASKAASIFGYPKVPLLTMIHWQADWIKRGGESLDKPTHFETRDGNY